MDDVQDGRKSRRREGYSNGRPARVTNRKRKVWRGEKCIEEGCERDPIARDLCGMHYQRRLRDGIELPPKVRVKMGGTQCIVESCIADAVAHGLCQRHASRSRRYGLTAEEIEQLEQQACAGCGATENLHVDHCHETHEVRGILCRSCNTVLGAVKDDMRTLIRLAAYIERSTR